MKCSFCGAARALHVMPPRGAARGAVAFCSRCWFVEKQVLPDLAINVWVSLMQRGLAQDGLTTEEVSSFVNEAISRLFKTQAELEREAAGGAGGSEKVSN